MGIDSPGTREPSPGSTLRLRPRPRLPWSSSSEEETWSWNGAAPQTSDSVTKVADADKLFPSSMLEKEEALGEESNAVDDEPDVSEYDPEDADENSAGVLAGMRGGRTMEEEGDSRSSPSGDRTGSM